MSLTGTQLLTSFSDYIGDLWQSTTSAIGAADGSTVVDSLTQRWGRDAVLDGYVRITSGTCLGQVRRVSGFTGATMTVAPAFTAQIDASVTYEFHRYDPVKKFSALDRGRIMAYPQLAVVKFDDSTTADGEATDFLIPTSIRKGPVQVFIEQRLVPNDPQNLLLTPRMDALTGWTATTLTAAVHTKSQYDFIIPKYGENYCTKISGSAGSYLQAVASMTGVTAASAAGRRMTFGLWVFCMTASSVKATIVDDSGSALSSFHGGNGWEFLQVTKTVSNTNTTLLSVGVETTVANTVAYLQDAKFRFGRKIFIPFKSLIPKRGLRRDDTDAEVYLTKIPSRGYQLRMIGRYPLSALGTNTTTQLTNTMEVDQFSQELLFAFAARVLFIDAGMSTGQIEQEHPKIAETMSRFSEMEEDWTYHYPNAGSVDGWWQD